YEKTSGPAGPARFPVPEDPVSDGPEARTDTRPVVDIAHDGGHVGTHLGAEAGDGEIGVDHADQCRADDDRRAGIAFHHAHLRPGLDTAGEDIAVGDTAGVARGAAFLADDIRELCRPADAGDAEVADPVDGGDPARVELQHRIVEFLVRVHEPPERSRTRILFG